MNTNKKTHDLVMTAVFTAIMIVMTSVPFLGYIPIGTVRATLVHIPVIIGAILLGPKYGAFLGFVFGCISLWMNTFAPTATSFVFSPFYSIGETGGNLFSLVICFVPRILIGVVAYYVYAGMKKITKQKEVLALAVSGIAGSLTNTILVMNLIYLLFKDSYATAKNIPVKSLYGIILGIIGANGVPEAIVAAIFTVVITKVLLRVKTTQ